MSDKPAVLIASSGTGGHLLPAVYIARALQRAAPGIRIEFIGAGRPLEDRIVVKAGFKRHVVTAVQVSGKGPAGIARFLAKLPRALLDVRNVFREVRPDIVIGVGGYVSVVPVLYGWLTGRPTWIHEAEMEPGMTARVLSLVATRISTAFPGTPFLRTGVVRETGHPVREDLRGIAELAVSEDAPRRLLVMGGSLGAQVIDDTMAEIAPLFAERGLELHHQCRPENVERLTACYRELGITAKVESFIEDLASVYRWCDLIIGRAGAGTVMEIGAIGRPALLVPYPHQQGAHQTKNAEYLVELGKAVVVEEGNRFKERLLDTLSRLSDRDTYAAMRNRPGAERSLDAADKIAAECLSLIQRRR